MLQYRAPRWLCGAGSVGGNVQTIWPALWSQPHTQQPRHAVPYQRERWDTPDGDFIDVDRWPAKGGALPGRPLLVLFHGLEGSSQSHYAQSFAHWAHDLGWDYAVPHFRGCSGEPNLAPRAYHSGDHVEIDWILRRVAQAHAGPVMVAGVSLGGNALLRWAQESGESASEVVRAVVAISAPVDLAAAGHAIGQGFNRQVYNRMFLNTLKPKALQKLQRHPGLFDRQAMLQARDLYEYDQVFTAPMHGFASTEDYWERASSKPGLLALKHVPTLLINARNDPFVPASSLPSSEQVGPAVTLWQPQEGGHVGFPSGRFPGHVGELPQAVGRWLQAHR